MRGYMCGIKAKADVRRYNNAITPLTYVLHRAKVQQKKDNLNIFFYVKVLKCYSRNKKKPTVVGFF